MINLTEILPVFRITDDNDDDDDDDDDVISGGCIPDNLKIGTWIKSEVCLFV